MASARLKRCRARGRLVEPTLIAVEHARSTAVAIGLAGRVTFDYPRSLIVAQGCSLLCRQRGAQSLIHGIETIVLKVVLGADAVVQC